MVNRASVAGRLLVGGLAWIAAGACAHGQTSDAPVIRVDVRQVLVPVIVTDSKGHHVTTWIIKRGRWHFKTAAEWSNWRVPAAYISMTATTC